MPRVELGEEWTEVSGAPERLERIVEHSCTILARTRPELYHLLTVELGWTPDAPRAWLTELLNAELLGGGP